MTPLTVAWISDYPLEWASDMPDPIGSLPKEHPATWEMVLLGEFEQEPQLRLHIIALRKNIPRSFSFQRKGVIFHVLKYFGGLRGPSLFWADTWLIWRALARIKPDLVHAWGNERGAGVVASRLPWPYLITVQGLFQWYREALPEFPGAKLSAWAERTSLARARDATTESKFSVAYLKRRYPRLTVHQAEHAPNPFFASVQRKPAQNPIRLVTNGTVSHRKGTDLFLQALAALMDEFPFEAVVIGAPNSSFLAPLRDSLPPALWQKVIFKSDLAPADVANDLAAATIFVLPTRADTSPNAVKEAVVAGVPVVASEVGGVPDYVVSGENGFLFPAGDLAGCIEALRRARRHPLFGAGRVAPETLVHRREYLSPARMADLFLRAYFEAAKRGPGSE